MKKLLALVLALVMTLGLATVSTSAAYSDQADINYDEAVDVMTAIGIFEGKSGAFDPKANLNRAEAAKVVAYLMLGNSTAENLKGIGTKFTDVPASHWAAGYIEYLASVGIVSGVGDNKFDPNGQVTGIQLAKMLLVALGYDAKIEGFVGPDWAINIQSIANKVGIYDGNDSIVGTAPVSRDEAALYAFNTIKSPLVEYDNTTTVNVSGATVTVGGNKAKYVVNNSTAKQTIDDAMEVNTNNYLVEFAEQYYKDLKLVLNDKVDDFGRPANTWTYKNEEIGTYVDFTEQVGAAYTAKVTQKMLYELLGKGVYDSLVAGRTTLTVYQDGVVTSVSRNDIDDYVNSENTGAVNSTGNGSETQVFMDDDDNVIVVTRHPYVFQASSDYNTTDKTLTLKAAGDTEYANNTKNITGSNLKLKNVDFDEALTEYKADDYVIAFVYSTNHKASNNGGSFKISEVSKAATLEGTVDSYKVDGEVVIDGTTYKYSKMTQKGSEHDVANNDPVQGTQFTVGQKAIVVLDQTGKYVIAVDEAIVSANYVFVADIAGTSKLNGKATAKVYFTDGSEDEVIIKKLVREDNAGKIIGSQVADAKIGSMTGVDKGGPSNNAGWYLYSKDSSGQYTLYSIPTTHKQADYIYAMQKDQRIGTDDSEKIATNGQVKFLTAQADLSGGTATGQLSTTFPAATDNASTDPEAIRANDKTIFIIDDDGDTLVYEGIKNLPDITLWDGVTKDNTGNDLDRTNPDQARLIKETGKAFVSVVYRTNGTYASYVYITLDGTYDVDSEGKALLYVVSYDGEFVRNDNDRYFKFKVLDGTNEITVEAETNLGKKTLTNSFYEAYYKVHKNSDEQYTSLDLITKNGDGSVTNPHNDGKYFSISGVNATGAKAALTGQLNEKDGALTIGNQSYTLADGYKIYMITPKAYWDQSYADDDGNAGVTTGDTGYHAGSAVMNGDTKADYKVEIVTAKQLVSRLGNYSNVFFNIQGRTDDDWSKTGANELVEAYVTVTRAENDINTHAVTFTGTNTVTQANGALPAAITENGAVSVVDGRDYTFTLGNTNTANYTVGAVTYTMNGSQYTLGTGIGTYTIRNVTGAVAINVAYTGPSGLTVTGLTNANVTALKINNVSVTGSALTSAVTAMKTSAGYQIADGAAVQVVIDATGENVLGSVTLDGVSQTITNNKQAVVSFTMNRGSAIAVVAGAAVATTTDIAVKGTANGDATVTANGTNYVTTTTGTNKITGVTIGQPLSFIVTATTSETPGATTYTVTKVEYGTNTLVGANGVYTISSVVDGKDIKVTTTSSTVPAAADPTYSINLVKAGLPDDSKVTLHTAAGGASALADASAVLGTATVYVNLKQAGTDPVIYNVKSIGAAADVDVNITVASGDTNGKDVGLTMNNANMSIIVTDVTPAPSTNTINLILPGKNVKLIDTAGEEFTVTEVKVNGTEATSTDTVQAVSVNANAAAITIKFTNNSTTTPRYVQILGTKASNGETVVLQSGVSYTVPEDGTITWGGTVNESMTITVNVSNATIADPMP